VRAAAAADVLLMAAAVADFRPATSADHKIKRAQASLDLHLEATADILAEVHRLRGGAGGRPAIVIGFAAESQELLANARAKLEAKGLAMIVANDITQPGAGFAGDTNRVTLLDAGGGVQELPLMSKEEVAGHVLDRVQALLHGSG
jgi:phosphopantothenoylcysteine decarboxylase/phosphopantothenate--cysteine ligase